MGCQLMRVINIGAKTDEMSEPQNAYGRQATG